VPIFVPSDVRTLPERSSTGHCGAVCEQIHRRHKARSVEFEEYDMPGLKTKGGIATGGGGKAAWSRTARATSWR
jgi:hypothetical protein